MGDRSSFRDIKIKEKFRLGEGGVVFPPSGKLEEKKIYWMVVKLLGLKKGKDLWLPTA